MKKQLRILMIEDSKNDALLIIDYLKQCGYELEYQRVETAAEMGSALNKTTWDIIYSDYFLPKFSGPEALKLLKKKKIETPFLIVSGKIGEEKAVEIIKAGADDYVMKDRLARLVPATEKLLQEFKMRKKYKLAQNELRLSEEKYRVLVENASEAIVVAQDGMLKYANPKAVDISGFSQKELLSKPFIELVHTDDQQLVAERYQRRLKGEELPQVYPFRILDTKGNTKWVELSAVLISWEGKPATLNFLNDVTQRKTSEDWLTESEREYKSLYSMVRLMCDNVPDLIWAKDMKREFVFTNKAMCDKLLNAKNTDEPIGKTDMYFADRERKAHSDNPDWHTFGEICRDSDSIVMKNRKAERFEEFGNVQGKFLYLDVYKTPFLNEEGEMIGTVGCGRDVTQEKDIEEKHRQAESALRESEEKFRSITASAQDAIVMADNNGNITYWNEAAEKIFGYTQEEVKGKKLNKLLAPERYYKVYKRGFKRFKEIGKGAVVGKTIELAAIKKNGAEFPIEISISSMKSKGEWHASAIIRDISNRKQAEEAQLKQTKKLKILNQVIVSANKANNLQSLLEQLLTSTLEFMDFDGGGIYLVNENEKITEVKYSKNLPQQLVDEIKIVKTDQKPYDTIFIKGEPIITDHFEQVAPERATKWGIKSLASIPFISKDKIVGAINIANKKQYSFSSDEKEILQAIGREAGTSIAKMLAEHALKESESRFRFIAETTGDVLYRLNYNTMIYDYLNPAISKLTGYSEMELNEIGFLSLIKNIVIPDAAEIPISDLKSDRMKGKTGEWKAEYQIKTKDGELKWLGDHSFPWKDDSGNIIGSVGIMQDITERKQAAEKIKTSLDENVVLLKEIHHRVKNNLQVIISLLYLQSKYFKDKKTLAIFQESQNRIRSMSLVHEKLYQSESLAKINFQYYIKDLANYLFRSYRVDSNNVKLKLNIEDVSLDVDSAIPCGLILNELVSNALKYAFPKGRAGEIVIELKSEKPDRLKLIVKDNGIGLTQDFESQSVKSLGFRLLNTLVDQLQGRMEIDRNQGAAFRIYFTKKEK